MTGLILSFYVILSFSLACIAVSTDWLEIPFGYEHLIEFNDLKYSLPIIWSLFIFLSVKIYYSFKFKDNKRESRHIDFGPNKFKFGFSLFRVKKINLISILIQLLLIFYFLCKIYFNYSSSSKGDIIIFRVLVGKESLVLLFIQSLILFLSRGFVKFIVFWGALFVALLFAWIDGSRSSLLPLSLWMLYLFSNKRVVLSFIVLLIQFFIYFLTAKARYINDKLDINLFLDAIYSAIQTSFDGFFGLISYVFGYSILHFIYVSKTELGLFTFNDLLYSVIPLPSSLNPLTVDVTLWRVDRYRPMGALSEVFRVSPIFLYVHFFLLGILSSKLDRMGDIYLRAFSLPIFTLVCVMMFQYHLRAVMWFVILLLIMLVLDRHLNKRKKRSHFV